jgi:hypothetical protein
MPGEYRPVPWRGLSGVAMTLSHDALLSVREPATAAGPSGETEYLSHAARFHGMSGRRTRRAISEMLDRVGLPVVTSGEPMATTYLFVGAAVWDYLGITFDS